MLGYFGLDLKVNKIASHKEGQQVPFESRYATFLKTWNLYLVQDQF